MGMYHQKKRKDKTREVIKQLKIDPLTPRVKPSVIQSFVTFDCMDRTVKCDH